MKLLIFVFKRIPSCDTVYIDISIFNACVPIDRYWSLVNTSEAVNKARGRDIVS